MHVKLRVHVLLNLLRWQKYSLYMYLYVNKVQVKWPECITNRGFLYQIKCTFYPKKFFRMEENGLFRTTFFENEFETCFAISHIKMNNILI